MNRKIGSAVLFLIVFIGTYLIVSFAIPGMRIKLDAEPIEVFRKSVAHMMPFKTMVSLAAALICGAIPLLLRKNR